MLCHIKKVKNKVRRKSSEGVSQRLVQSDFFTTSPVLQSYKWNRRTVRNTNKKNQIFKVARFNNRNLQHDLPGHMVCAVIHSK